MEDREYI